MAFVSGGSGGGIPPQSNNSNTNQNNQQQQILEALLLQQHAVQQASQSQQPNAQNALLGQLVANALMQNQAGSNCANLPQPTAQAPAANLLLNVLNNQMNLNQMINPQMQQQNQTSALLQLAANPTLALYYQQILQQNALAQQFQHVQQQAQQQQQQQAAAAASSQQNSAVQGSVMQISNQQQSAFQPTQASAHSSSIGSGSVESQLNAQERLLNSYLNEQQQQQLAAAQLDRTNVPRNSKEMHDRINKIISDNEVIVQPQEPLLKRRPYHRQGQQSSMEQDSNSSSTRTSPGARDIRMLQATGRTQSMYEPLSSGRIFGGSLTSGQPLIRQQPIHHTPECNYCQVAFPNEAGLQMHELRCSKRLERLDQERSRLEAETAASLASAQIPSVSSGQTSQNSPTVEIENNSRHPLKRRLLAAANYEAQEQASPQPPAKLQRKDSGDIIVVGETKGTPRKEQPHQQQSQIYGFNRRATISNIPVAGTSTPISAVNTLSLHQLNQLNSLMSNQTAFTQVTPRTIQPSVVSASPAVAHTPTPLAPPTQIVAGPSGSTAATVPATPQIIRISTVREPSADEDDNPLGLSILKKLDGNLDKPYTLMLADNSSAVQNRLMPNDALKKNRGRSITSESYVCIQRIQPMFVEHKGQLSMYRNWFQSSTREPDPRLNRFIKYFSPHPDVGVYDRYRYTIATREMVQYKVTHSSFWDLMKKTRIRQLAEPADPLGTVDVVLEPPTIAMPVTNTTLVIKEEEMNEISSIKDEIATTSSYEAEQLMETKTEDDNNDDFEFKPTPMRNLNKKNSNEPLIGGHRTDEVYVYVRGRGRGRYVCDTCGIRCKKPSMLKKHIRSHYDVRPYKCKQCNFSFKTKGNLTKHLGSKAHRRKIENGADYMSDDDDDENRLEIVDEPEDEPEVTSLTMPEDEETSDEEDNMHLERNDEKQLRVGQENILFERNAHTPLSRWVCHRDDQDSTWPMAENSRSTRSAPPAWDPKTDKNGSKEDSPGTEIMVQPAVLFGTMANSVTQQPANQNLTSIQLGNNIQQQGNIAFMNPQSTVMYNNFVATEESLKCDQCERTFRKASELSYHQHTHILEKQNAKNRMFQCPECRLPLKTKALLAKHVETSHGSHIDDSVTASVDPSASTQSVLGGGNGQVANNPRSFMCSDCNIGFRKHGILAKHLRSKTHVMKLETLRRIPEDSLSLITKRDNGACLNEIDTADCDKARLSLIAIVEAIRSQNHLNHSVSSLPGGVSNSPAMSQMPSIIAPPPLNNLECREQMIPSPVPASIVINRLPLNSNGTSAFTVQPVRCFSEANSPMRGKYTSTNDLIHGKRPESVAMRSDPGTLTPTMSLQHNKLVSANVWVPPRQENSLVKPSDLLVSQMAQQLETAVQNAEGAYAMTDIATPFHSNGSVASSPLLPPNSQPPANPKCGFCLNQFENQVDYQVHLLVDHFSVMDGQNFKCPTKFCGKVYPNKLSLRSHVISHYMNGTESVNGDSRDDSTPMSSVVATSSEGVVRGISPLSEGTDSTCQSPQNDTAPVPSDSRPASSTEVLRLPCILCNQLFTDAAALQQHWLGHVSTRNHVCQVCDAGFTTPEALNNHSHTHRK